MKAISSALSMKLIGTSTAPIRASAKRKAAKACELRDRTATRSPGRIPCAQSPAASRLQMASNSAKVHFVSPQLIAVLFGTRPAVRRSRSDRLC